MKEGLLKLLKCLACGSGNLILDVAFRTAEGEVMEGEIRCVECRKKFPVIRGVPRFVESDDYVGSFSFEWKIHRTTQIDNVGNTESRSDFFLNTGFKPEELSGKMVLDAGVGTGRYADICLDAGAEVYGIDLSFSVDSAFENFGRQQNFHLLQADILNLPFKQESFDIIYSLGVLHHTKDTKEAFRCLVPLLKPGGTIVVWVYEQKAYSYISNRIRKITTRLPKKLLYALCYFAVPLGLIYKIPFIGKIFWLAVPFSTHKRWKNRVLNTFDWYSPVYQHKHTYPEVYQWFKEGGFVDIDLLPHSVSIKAKKKVQGN